MQTRVMSKAISSLPHRKLPQINPHLIFCGGEGMKTAVLSLKRSGYEAPVTLVSHPSWITSIHQDWYHNRWGQSPLYLPPELFEIFKIKFPDHPLDDPMSFEQIKTIYLSLEEVIHQHPTIEFVSEKISAVQQGPKDVKILDSRGHAVASVGHHNFYVFNSAKTPKMLKDSDLPLEPFSAVYSLAKRDIAERRHVVMIGSGLNTSWALQDLNIPIIYLIPPHDHPAATVIEHDNCLCAINMRDKYFRVNPYSEFLYEVIGRDLKTQKILTFYVDVKSFYASMGTEFNQKIVQVDPRKVCAIDTSAKVEDLRRYVDSQGTIKTKPEDMRGTKIPNGNLTHVHYANIGKFGFYMTYPIDNPQTAMFNFDHWKKTVTEKIKMVRAKINPEFFDNLYILVKYANTDQISTPKKMWKVIKNAYTKTHPSHINHSWFPSEPEYLSWYEFQQLLLGNTPVLKPHHHRESYYHHKR